MIIFNLSEEDMAYAEQLQSYAEMSAIIKAPKSFSSEDRCYHCCTCNCSSCQYFGRNVEVPQGILYNHWPRNIFLQRFQQRRNHGTH